MGTLKISLVFCILLKFGYSANILGVFPVPSRSHDILGSALFKHLASIGHNVTYISTFQHDIHKNFHAIHLKGSQKFREERMKMVTQGNLSIIDMILRDGNTNEITCEFFEDEAVRELMSSGSKFDVMVHFMGIDATLVLGEIFDVPIIVFSPVGGFTPLDQMAGNPAPPSYVPNVILPFTDDMNLLERTVNVIFSYTILPLSMAFLKGAGNKHLQKYLPGSRTIEEIFDRIDLMLVNTHLSVESPRPYVPSMIQIGGFHLQKPEPLSESLKRVLDEAEEGFVYFSFGTNVNVKELPENVLSVFKKVLGNLPLKIVMKYTDDDMPNAPKNFHIAKWFPQPSVLAHPNAKLFISHGGYGGCTESLFHGVPMVCIPFFGDQPKNCADAEHNGYSLTIKLDNLNEETFSNALEKVLYDQTFKDAVRFKSELYRDQPMNPMDKAVYWIEHVIKHKGAKHLKVKGATLPWYQYHLLDVFVFVGTILYIIFSITFYSFRFVWSKICGSKSKIKVN